MMSAPTSRVDTPHDVAHTYSSSLFLFWKVQSNAFAKFWPRKWLVPACSALPSCFSASMKYVLTEPANSSLGDFKPCSVSKVIYIYEVCVLHIHFLLNTSQTSS